MVSWAAGNAAPLLGTRCMNTQIQYDIYNVNERLLQDPRSNPGKAAEKLWKIARMPRRGQPRH